MTKKDYTEFDAALLVRIASGANTACALDANKEIHRLAAPHQGQYTPVFRVIDRRLQALRKAKKIAFNCKCWKVL